MAVNRGQSRTHDRDGRAHHTADGRLTAREPSRGASIARDGRPGHERRRSPRLDRASDGRLRLVPAFVTNSQGVPSRPKGPGVLTEGWRCALSGSLAAYRVPATLLWRADARSSSALGCLDGTDGAQDHHTAEHRPGITRPPGEPDHRRRSPDGGRPARCREIRSRTTVPGFPVSMSCWGAPHRCGWSGHFGRRRRGDAAAHRVRAGPHRLVGFPGQFSAAAHHSRRERRPVRS